MIKLFANLIFLILIGAKYVNLPIHFRSGPLHISHSKYLKQKNSSNTYMHLRRNDLSHHLVYHDQSQNQQSYSLTTRGQTFTIALTVSGLNYNMELDTGSSDFFIKGEQTIGIPQKRYTCGASCLGNNSKYTLKYLDGIIQTYEIQLQVALGKNQFNQSVLVAYSTSNTFENTQGILGLSFPSLAKNPNPTFLQTLINKKIINNYAFGVNFNFQQGSRSFLSLGSPDNSFFSGTLLNFTFIEQNFYITSASGVITGSSGLFSISSALFDTGNTCISIPSGFQSDLLNNFNVQNNSCFYRSETGTTMFKLLMCQVTNFESLPNLLIVLNGQFLNVEKQAYLQRCSRKPGDHIQNDLASEGIWYCSTFIQSVQDTKIYLGGGFFNRYYAYFNIQNNSIGLAKNLENLTLDLIASNQYSYVAADWAEFDEAPAPQSLWDRIVYFFSNLF